VAAGRNPRRRLRGRGLTGGGLKLRWKRAGKRNFDFTTRVTDLYKETDGRWMVIHEHLSVPVDLATGTPDLSSKHKKGSDRWSRWS
jgi:hypothetical protein